MCKITIIAKFEDLFTRLIIPDDREDDILIGGGVELLDLKRDWRAAEVTSKDIALAWLIICDEGDFLCCVLVAATEVGVTLLALTGCDGKVLCILSWI